MREIKFVKKEPISKGWSSDQKFCVTAQDSTKYLLRISSFEKSETCKKMFRMQQKVAELGIPMCKPVRLDSCEERIYTLQTWIDGEDAQETMPALSDTEQYAYGWEAGCILQKIHSIPAPKMQEDWETRFNRKIDNKIKKYRECSIQYENGQALIDYINKNRHLLKGRPQVFQYGDYHIGNMMIDRKGTLQIIDFDRCDFGDLWEEFNRIVWCAQKSPLFATGMVNGYFRGEVPLDFWKLLALYISSNTLASVSWAIPFGQDEVDVMLKQAKEVFSWYDGMCNFIPTWYSKGRMETA